jgi:hypothetical protein
VPRPTTATASKDGFWHYLVLVAGEDFRLILIDKAEELHAPSLPDKRGHIAG